MRKAGVAISGAALLVAIAAGAPLSAGAARHRVVERPIRSRAPDANLVKESLVKVHSRLPASYGPHPKACDWISSLRFRHAG
ncbi:MAG TPA: hypothetical protein VKG89_08910 [Solirubrobacterales bacterium]|nr:hypothetical protein [Solirubrobacterales bacterium]